MPAKKNFIKKIVLIPAIDAENYNLKENIEQLIIPTLFIVRWHEDKGIINMYVYKQDSKLIPYSFFKKTKFTNIIELNKNFINLFQKQILKQIKCS